MEGARLVPMGSESEFGRYLAALRRESGKSQRRLAELLCEVSGRDTVTRHEVSRWERGEREPTSWLPHLATVLDVPLDRLERVLANSLRGASDEPEPSTQLTLSDLLPETSAWQFSTVGRRIGMEAAENLAARAHGLRLADDLVPSRDLVTPAFRELRTAVRLFRETSHSEEVAKALLSAIGEFAQIAGWIASDAGRHVRAEEIYRLGLSAARQADDKSLVANLAGSLAYQHANTGREPEAIDLARAAMYESGTDTHPVVQALTLDRVAWAETEVSHPQAAMKALTEAHEAISRQTSQEPPAWAYWVSPDELGVMDARVYTELQRPLRAVPLLTKILDRYDATHARTSALPVMARRGTRRRERAGRSGRHRVTHARLVAGIPQRPGLRTLSRCPRQTGAVPHGRSRGPRRLRPTQRRVRRTKTSWIQQALLYLGRAATARRAVAPPARARPMGVRRGRRSLGRAGRAARRTATSSQTRHSAAVRPAPTPFRRRSEAYETQ
jgi:transcriptional regulator with XRE-family HTH domain